MTQQKRNDKVNATNQRLAPVVSVAPDHFMPTWLTQAGDMRPDHRARAACADYFPGNRCTTSPMFSAVRPQNHICLSPNTPEYHVHVSQSPLKKCAQSILSAVWQWEYKIIGSRLFFLPQSHIFQPFQQSASRKKDGSRSPQNTGIAIDVAESRRTDHIVLSFSRSLGCHALHYIPGLPERNHNGRCLSQQWLTISDHILCKHRLTGGMMTLFNFAGTIKINDTCGTIFWFLFSFLVISADVKWNKSKPLFPEMPSNVIKKNSQIKDQSHATWRNNKRKTRLIPHQLSACPEFTF